MPFKIREALNTRLREGHSGRELVDALNDLPAVRAVLAAQFGGRPITVQNLSEWKSGGYAEWLLQQETIAQVRELAAVAGQLSRAGDGALSDHLALLLTTRYAQALTDWDGAATKEFLRILGAMRGFCKDVVELRRGDHNAAYLKIEQARFKREDAIAKIAENAQRERHRLLTPEEKQQKMREIFGLVDTPARPHANDQPPRDDRQTFQPNPTKSDHPPEP